mgnify:CR=1 FL=1
MSNVKVIYQRSQVIISIIGHFDSKSLHEFRSCYKELAGGDMKILVDLEQAVYMDSSAIGMLLAMKDYLGCDYCAIEILNCQPKIMKIFKITNLGNLFKIT